MTVRIFPASVDDGGGNYEKGFYYSKTTVKPTGQSE